MRRSILAGLVGFLALASRAILEHEFIVHEALFAECQRRVAPESNA